MHTRHIFIKKAESIILTTGSLSPQPMIKIIPAGGNDILDVPLHDMSHQQEAVSGIPGAASCFGNPTLAGRFLEKGFIKNIKQNKGPDTKCRGLCFAAHGPTRFFTRV